MANVSTVIDRVVKVFNRSANVDTLSGGMNNSTTSLGFSGILPAWGEGTIVEVGSELMLVRSVDAGSNVATVVRGWLNSTAETHSAGDPIFVNPRVNRDDVLDIINDCLTKIYPTIYKVATVTHTYSTSIIGYNMPANADKILAIQYEANSSQNQWSHIGDYEFHQNMDTNDFAGGNAVMIKASMPSAADIRVTYAEPFVRFSAESQDMTTVAGLKDYMTDLLFYFSMNRLAVQEELENIQKKDAQQHQRSQESPPFLSVRTGEWYQARFDELLNDCKNRLKLESKPFIMTRYGS